MMPLGVGFAPDFRFVAPVVGPFDKSEFVDSLKSFDLKTAFPSMSSNYHHWRVCPFEPIRVWCSACASANAATCAVSWSMRAWLKRAARRSSRSIDARVVADVARLPRGPGMLAFLLTCIFAMLPTVGAASELPGTFNDAARQGPCPRTPRPPSGP